MLAAAQRDASESYSCGRVRWDVDGRDGIARFELADVDRHHHHFVDDDCGEVRTFTDVALEDAIDAVAGRLGVVPSSHDVILRGVARGASDAR